jgi:membrane-bound metal-dependent hydrolase YbcI (DUF457 family)
MFEITVANGLTWAVAAFFMVGAIGNWIAPPAIRADYKRWGYPNWFHYVTAVLELTTALLLVFPATRVLGAGLGVLVMLFAAATVLRHREFGHAVAPATVAVLSAVAGWLSL